MRVAFDWSVRHERPTSGYRRRFPVQRGEMACWIHGLAKMAKDAASDAARDVKDAAKEVQESASEALN
jgi:hypothetical protein